MLRIIIILLFLPSLLHAQEELKWGKISKFEKNYNECDFDPEADAVVLADEGNIYFEFINGSPRVYLYRHVRTKILSKSGLEHADVRLVFPDQRRILSLKAQTITNKGKKIKIGRKDIFEEELNDEHRIYSFSFPQAEVGSIIEYSYLMESEYILTFPTWYYNEDVSVIRSSIQFDIPPYFEYVQIHSNGHKLQHYEPVKIYDINIDKEIDRYKITGRNLLGVKAEKYITTISDYYTQTEFQLRRIHYPNQQPKDILESWDKLAQKLRDHKMFGDQYLKDKHNKEFFEEINPQLDSIRGDKERANALYDLLNEKVKWDEKFSFFASDDLEKIFNNKLGNSADLNLMFLSLLRKTGITSYPVLISTRSHGAPKELYPIVTQFNHLVVLVEIEGDHFYYDLSDKFLPYQCVRYEALNRKGLLIKDDEQFWVPIKISKGADKLLLQMELHPDDNTITAHMTARYSNLNSMPERRNYVSDLTGSHWQKRFEPNYSTVEVISAEPKYLYHLNEEFEEHVQLKMTGGLTTIDSFIYFKPITYSNFDENPLKQESRHCPVDFAYPFNETIICNYIIPEGYYVEDIPENKIIHLGDKNGTYRFLCSYNETNRLLQISSTLDVNEILYHPEAYKYIKEFFDFISGKMQEQVVLKKL